MKTIVCGFIFLAWLALSAKSQEIGSVAPDFELTSVSDQPFKLSEQKGKLVVIFIFGYNCPFCISFAPTSESDLHQKYNSRDDFIMVGIDSWNGSKTGVQSFQSKTGVTYPLLMNGSEMAKAYETTYDRLLVVDKEGFLRHSNKNTVAKNDLNDVLSTIEQYIDNTVTSADKHINESEISIFPNPVQDKLNVRFSEKQFNKWDQVFIFDLTGKVVLNENVHKQTENITINISGLPKGIYVLRFQANQSNSEVIKFSKK